MRTIKKATLQSRDYPAIETPTAKSGVWSHDLKVENTITYGSKSRAHKHVRTNKKATLQSRDYTRDSIMYLSRRWQAPGAVKKEKNRKKSEKNPKKNQKNRASAYICFCRLRAKSRI